MPICLAQNVGRFLSSRQNTLRAYFGLTCCIQFLFLGNYKNFDVYYFFVLDHHGDRLNNSAWGCSWGWGGLVQNGWSLGRTADRVSWKRIAIPCWCTDSQFEFRFTSLSPLILNSICIKMEICSAPHVDVVLISRNTKKLHWIPLLTSFPWDGDIQSVYMVNQILQWSNRMLPCL